MTLDAVLEVLSALESARCRAWIAGGWGVDALAGRQTREHRDLDLAIDAADEAATLSVLSRLGYVIETDWRPVRLELAAGDSRWVDVHPVRFGPDGTGRQPDLDGGAFEYPPECFVQSELAGRLVNCLSAAQQIEFRQGYELRDVDHHDLAVLSALNSR